MTRCDGVCIVTYMNQTAATATSRKIGPGLYEMADGTLIESVERTDGGGWNRTEFWAYGAVNISWWYTKREALAGCDDR